MSSNHSKPTLESAFDRSLAFYENKTKRYKTTVKLWTWAARILAWSGGSMLAMSAYDLLEPLLSIVGLGCVDHPFHFVSEHNQAVATLLISVGIVIGESLRRRGLFRAYARYGRTLTSVESLKATYEIDIAIAEDVEKGKKTLSYMHKLVEITSKERDQWAEDLEKDLTAWSNVSNTNSNEK